MNGVFDDVKKDLSGVWNKYGKWIVYIGGAVLAVKIYKKIR